MRHSRSKSFSDSLVLEDMDKGGVIVKSIRADSSTEVGLKEGDEIIGATIHFDKLKKDEVLRVLKLIELYDENMKVLTKENLEASVSSGILNNYIASPKEMLEDSYTRLFHCKVQRFLDREPSVCDAAKTSDDTIGDLNSQLHGTRLQLDGPSFKNDIAGPSQNLSSMVAQTAQVDIDAKRSGSKIQDTTGLEDSSFNVPNFSRSRPMPPMGLSSKLKEPDDLENNGKCLDVNLSGPNSKCSDRDLNLTIDRIEGGDNVSGIEMLDNSTHCPELDLKAPDVDLKSPSEKCTYPTLPKFGMSGPNVKGPEMGIDGDQETPGLNCSSPEILTENITPQFGVDLPKAKFTTPKFSLSGPKVKGPDLDINARLESPDLNPPVPKVKGGIRAPDIGLNLPSADMKGTELNMDAPDIDLKSPSLKCKFPTLPKFGISGPKLKRTEVDIDADLKTPDLNLSVPKIKGEINDPELAMDLPKADLNGPKLRTKTPHLAINAPSGKFTIPKFSPSGPKVKRPDFDIDTSLKTPDLNLKAPMFNGGIRAPDIGLNLPSADMKGTKLNMDAPDIDLKSPSCQFESPTLPNFGISGPKVKHPEMDICEDLETPDLDLSAPKMKGKIYAPQFQINASEFGSDLPKADLNIPKLGMKMPDLDIDAPSGKFTMPKFSMAAPKVKTPDFDIDAGLKTPDLNLKAHKIKGRIKAPDIGLNLPSDDMKGSKFHWKIPDVDLKIPSRQFKFPTLPKFGISGPKLKRTEVDIDADLKTPDLNLSVPKIKGEMNAPELGMDLPKADLNGPKLGTKTPHLAINAPSGKFTMPKFSLSGPKVKRPDFDIDTSLKTPDLNLPAPKVKGGIKGPHIGSTLPSADMKGTELIVDAPNVDLKSPSLKFKFPTLPKFGTSGPKVKCPELDIDGDLETPDFNLSAPKIKGEMNAPELGMDLPKADLNSPKLGTKTPHLAINAPSGKFTMPKFSLSGPKVKRPDFDIDTSLKTPDLNLKAPKFKGGIRAPDIGLNLPSTDMKGTELNMDAPDIDLKSPSRQFKSPTLPNFGISGPKGKHPEMDICEDLETPDLDLSAPKMKGEIYAPQFQINASEFGSDLPKADFNIPKLGMKMPDLDIDAPSGKFTMPKLNLSGPKVKGPDLDIHASLETADLNLPAPKVKGGIKGPHIGSALPSADMKGTELNVDVPNVDLKSPSLKFKFPTLPKFRTSGPKVKCPELDIDGDLETPDFNLSAPKIKGEMNATELVMDLPKADLNSPKLGTKTPHLAIIAPSGKFTMPKFNPSRPKVKRPDFDINTSLKNPDLNLKAPKFKGGITAPDIGLNLPSADMKGTELNMDAPDIDLKSPSRQFKSPTLPNFGISGPKVKHPEIEICEDLETPDLDLSAPKMKGKIYAPQFQNNASEFGSDLPKADVNIPKLGMKMPDLDIDAPSGKFTKPKFSMAAPKVKTPDFDIDAGMKTSNLNLTAPKIKGRIKTTEVDIDLPNGDKKGCKRDLKVSNFDLKSHTIKGEISSPDVIQSLPQTDIKESLNLNTPHLDLDAPSGKLNVPTLKRPKYGPSEFNMNRQQLDIDAVVNEADLSASKKKSAINTHHVDLCIPKNDMSTQVVLQASSNDASVHSGKIKVPTVTELKSGSSELSIKEQDLYANENTMDVFPLTSEVKAGLKTSDKSDISPKANLKGQVDIPKPNLKNPSIVESTDLPKLKGYNLPVSTNTMCAPDIDLEVPGGTLKRSKVKLIKAFI